MSWSVHVVTATQAYHLPYRSSKHRETSAEREERKAEKRTRRSAEAALTLPMRQAVAETSFYSSTDNPFHDANLGDQFVWGKKKEKEKKQGMTPEEARRRDIERHLESQVSLLIPCGSGRPPVLLTYLCILARD